MLSEVLSPDTFHGWIRFHWVNRPRLLLYWTVKGRHPGLCLGRFTWPLLGEGWEPGKYGVSKPSDRPTIQLKDGEKPMAETKEKEMACCVEGDAEAAIFRQELKTPAPKESLSLWQLRGAGAGGGWPWGALSSRGILPAGDLLHPIPVRSNPPACQHLSISHWRWSQTDILISRRLLRLYLADISLLSPAESPALPCGQSARH